MTTKNPLKKYMPTSRNRRVGVAVALAAAVSLPIAAAAAMIGDHPAPETSFAPGGGYGGRDRIPGETIGMSLPEISEPLSAAELESLVYMREEEKLAHDVYVTLGGIWDDDVFTRIASAESSHQDALVVLLGRYGVDDPTPNAEVGVFANPSLQSLYDDLVAQGSISALDAYRVGAMIEELDIMDLREAADGTDQEAIIEVLARLEAGSNNHLRAFDSRIQAAGDTYETSFLDQEDYDSIAAAPQQRGGHGQGEQQGRGGHGQRGRGN